MTHDPAGPRTRLLLSAFACDPITGGEPNVGWQWAHGLAKRYDLTVLSRSYSADAIARAAPGTRLRMIHFDLPGARDKDHYWRWIKPYYMVWQFCALFFAGWHHMRRRFDVIHHLTYNVVDMPGFLAFIPGAKFVWGPVGGGQVPPESLRQVFGPGWRQQRLRAALKAFTRWNPLVMFAAWRAHHVFFANRETEQVAGHWCRNRSLMLETAIAPAAAPHPPQGEVFELLWLSRVEAIKALPMAIEAFALMRRENPQLACKLVVGGDGPALPQARACAAELGVGGDVRFLGRIPFEEVMNHMRGCDAFVFTSVRDTSGNVVLEAMSCGKPVICLDHQGVAGMVTAQSGIKVAVGTYGEVVRGLAEAMRVLASDRAATAMLGEQAWREIAGNHTWQARIDNFARLVGNAR